MPSPTFKRRTHSAVVPDHLDLRDRMYQPPVGLAVGQEKRPGIHIRVRDQKNTSACTGFALGTVVDTLLSRSGRAKLAPVSRFMIYDMARRYDEFPGVSDSGSSLRGAMKGWYKHGVCSEKLWPSMKMPKKPSAEGDWWADAALRPLGAYYRVDTRSVADMHVALNETGVLYASAVCHAGWDEGYGLPTAKKKGWVIPARPVAPEDGGHAFAIVGYTRKGFVVQNSWSNEWGEDGLGVLSYEDWGENAMDCWVAQLGVVTEHHQKLSRSAGIRAAGGGTNASVDTFLRNHEVAPYVIDMENNGLLSATGEFRTSEADVAALVTTRLASACAEWGITAGDTVDIAVYAHGGLVSEKDAAAAAAVWIPELLSCRVYPIVLMWESDLLSTLRNRFRDLVKGYPPRTGGLRDVLRRHWNRRVERLLSGPGSMVWGEMKQNAECISGHPKGGGRLLADALKSSPELRRITPRLHLIGHSAGAIVHSHVANYLGAMGFRFETLTFMAPAVRVDTFRDLVVPALKGGTVKRYQQFHLSDALEQKDPTCRKLLGYSRSLLCLVANSFEKGEKTPILGLETDYESHVKALGLERAEAYSSPGACSNATTHGGFDDDPKTVGSVVASIMQR